MTSTNGKKTFYITTPIYYPSDNLHIGHAYCSTAADSMARFKKLTGYDTYFLTGTDEHGQKIEKKAIAQGVTPQAYVDHIVAGIKDLWKLMDIEYDDFIRTTDDRHVKAVQKIFRQLYDQGDIYKAEYEGWYCTPCESFWTELQLKDGCCPDCGRPVEKTQEESYFFRMNKYAPWLIQYIEEHPDFIQPASRANEMINNFLKPGLQDLCVSRTSVKWGIPVDFDPKHTVYVWIDALSNYITALGYSTDHDELYRKYWPADVHLVGKEIVRFHTIYWPIMLHALGLPLPRQVFGHGWLVIDGRKMGKSVGNVVDPVVLCERYSSDAVRYFLMREMPFGNDGEFTLKAMLTRVNADLANDLGNLVSRTVAMIEKYYGGDIPSVGVTEDLDREVWALAEAMPGKVEEQMNALQFSAALQEIWKLIGECNRYIDQTQPWVLGRTDEGKPRLGTVLYTLAECVRRVAVCVGFVMPRTPERIFAQLGVEDPALKTWDSVNKPFGALPAGGKVHKGEALFPRLDIQKEIDRDQPAEEAKSDEAPAKKENRGGEKAVKKEEKHAEQEFPEQIGIDTFAQCKMQVARVLECVKVEKSSKLLQFRLSFGPDGERTILSGIAKYYHPEELVGKQIVAITNLAPRKIAGIESQGMILSALDGAGNLRLLSVGEGVEDGAIVG